MNVIVAVGDSLTWATERYFWQSCGFGRGPGRYNLGRQGSPARYDMSCVREGNIYMNLSFPAQKITDLVTQAALTDAVLPVGYGGSRTARTYRLIVLIGTNNVSADPAIEAASIGVYCAARAAAGWLVTVGTIPGEGVGGGGNDAGFATPLNALLRSASWQSTYNVLGGCLDFGGTTEYATNNYAFLNTAYYDPDQTHPSSVLGGATMGNMFRDFIHRVIPPGTTYSWEAQQFLDRLPDTPSATVRSAYVAFIDGLRDAGLWNAFDGFYLYSVDTEANAKINLMQNAYNITKEEDPTAITFSAFKYFSTTGNGGNLNSGFNLSTATNGRYQQDYCSAGVWNATGTSVAGLFDIIAKIGSLSFSNNVRIFANWSPNAGASINTTGTIQNTVANGSGLTVARRTAANAYAVFKNGSSLQTGADASAALPNATLVNVPQRNTQAWFFGRYLTDTENSALYTLLGNFITATYVP